MGFLFSRFWGNLSDKIGNRKLFIFMGILLTSIITPAYAFYEKPLEKLAFYTLASFFAVMIYPPVNALVSTLDTRHRGGKIGSYLAYAIAGSTIGSFTGGFIISLMGYDTMYYISTITGILASVLILGFREPRVEKVERSFKELLQLSIKFETFGSRDLKYLTYSFFIQSLSGSLFYNLFIIKLYIIVEKDPTIYGIINSLAGFPSIFASKIYGNLTDRIGRRKMYTIATAIYSPYFLALSIIDNIWIISILWALPIWLGVQIPAIALATDLSSKTNVAGIQGLLQTSSSLAIIIGPTIGGLLADALNTTKNINNIQIILYTTSILPIISATLAKKIVT